MVKPNNEQRQNRQRLFLLEKSDLSFPIRKDMHSQFALMAGEFPHCINQRVSLADKAIKTNADFSALLLQLLETNQRPSQVHYQGFDLLMKYVSFSIVKEEEFSYHFILRLFLGQLCPRGKEAMILSLCEAPTQK